MDIWNRTERRQRSRRPRLARNQGIRNQGLEVGVMVSSESQKSMAVFTDTRLVNGSNIHLRKLTSSTNSLKSTRQD